MNTIASNERVYLISCSKTKLNYSARAEELYTSTLFAKSMGFAKMMIDTHGGRIGILSAKHGLVLPNSIIAPYDKTLNSMNKQEKHEWAKNVFKLILDTFGTEAEYVFIAGKQYHCLIAKMMDANKIKYNILMNGLGIGQRLKYLNEQMENRK